MVYNTFPKTNFVSKVAKWEEMRVERIVEMWGEVMDTISNLWDAIEKTNLREGEE